MIESIFDDLAGIAAVILFIWSVALVWATWHVQRMVRSLDEERELLRRWSRLRELEKRQNTKWQ